MRGMRDSSNGQDRVRGTRQEAATAGQRGACWAAWGLAAILSCKIAVEAGPLLRRVAAAGGLTNLVANGGFEQTANGRFGAWVAAPDGYRAAPAEGRSGSAALVCDSADTTGWRGASQTLTLNRATPAPIVVRGWSRAEGVSGSADSGYSIYVDIVYADGTPLWGQTGNFRCGTHDWEQREFVILPEKPVRTLSLYCLVRGHSGRVWFDDIAVAEVVATGNAVVFQGTPMQWTPPPEALPGTRRSFETGDGLRLELAGDWVTSVKLAGRELAGGGVGGFLAQDVGAGSDVFGFAEGVCSELGLRLSATLDAQPDRVVVEGRVTDTRGADRAVMLLFALPIDATGWIWGDDIRRQRVVSGRAEYGNATAVGCGTTGGLAVYPIAAVHNGRTGLALGIDMSRPAVYRLVYHAGTRQLFVAYDFGLARDTGRFPGAAEFRLVLYRFDGQWGFRAAWDRYMALFPEHFAVRSREQGIWMPFTDISTVEGWADFGFRYHEGNNNVPFDDRNGILSFRYLEPMTWWMKMAPALPRTVAEALRVRDETARGSGWEATMAALTQSAGMVTPEGEPALLFQDTPWANGAVWSLNPNPALPSSPNAGTVYWNERVKAQGYGAEAKGRQDGEYIDSIEGYVTAELNYRREHFRHTTVPLTFDRETRRPALFKGLAVCEFTRWLSGELHRLDRLVFANGVPYRFGFLCPWLDVMGTETDWMRAGRYAPASPAQLDLWRTLAGAKPYLLLMNTDFDAFGSEAVERYFQRSLFYGMYPSMFSHNAAENPYWRNPKWYNRDRALFRKYQPLIRRVGEAGWQPVTLATCDNASIAMERFGPALDGVTYFTLWNDTAATQSGVLRLTASDTSGAGGQTAKDLLRDQRLTWDGTGWPVSVAPGAVGLVAIEPGR